MHFSTIVLAAIVSWGYLAIPALSAPTPAHHPAYNASLINRQSATGQANVLNQCTFPVYLYVCGEDEYNGGDPDCSGIQTLAAQGGTYAETYWGPNNGRSIKMSTVYAEGSDQILQFEYTNTGYGQVSYDLSEVNGNPFGQYGFTLWSSNPSCFQSSCPPPSTSCPSIFTQPTNGIPYDCPISDGLGVTLCG